MPSQPGPPGPETTDSSAILIEDPAEEGKKGTLSPIEHEQYRIETIRVPTQKLDALMRQVGELTTTKIHIARRLAELEELLRWWEEWNREALGHRSLVHEWKQEVTEELRRRTSAYLEEEGQRLEHMGRLLFRLRHALDEDQTRLELVTNELEDGVRAVRLLPLSTLFQRFPRLVRDLARTQGKEVHLEITGGETSADKRILEEMKDPLTHLIRNAIDHGIEPPAERERAGKPRRGTISLRAYQTATNIIIEVADDGRGLDPEAIRRTALQRRICGEDELALMTPEQVQSLIFTSGFSTSPLITDLSGRGVGLDVVRTNVEHLKGDLRVESSPGQGCTFSIRLPITLATSRVLIVMVAQRSYALPVEYVHTTRLVAPSAILTVQGRKAILQEGKPISLVPLADLLEIQTAKAVPASSQ
ncbi:MAG: hybrid sensor histidine kinase/response regulator, partial [Nitrospinota bacterium]